MRWLVLLLVLIANVAWSNGPIPRPAVDSDVSQGHASKANKKAAADPQGTDKNPFVVKRLDAEETPERRTQQAQEREEKSALERRLVFWTWVLAVVAILAALIAGGQLVMFFKQLKLMETATIASGGAAHAAEQSVTQMRDTAQHELRPYVAIDQIYFGNVPLNG